MLSPEILCYIHMDPLIASLTICFPADFTTFSTLTTLRAVKAALPKFAAALLLHFSVVPLLMK